MTFSHDQIQEHLLGFLDGELTGKARSAFDAHLSGCEACRGEVRGIEQARALAREVVRAPLANPVSSEVRARVLAFEFVGFQAAERMLGCVASDLDHVRSGWERDGRR